MRFSIFQKNLHIHFYSLHFTHVCPIQLNQGNQICKRANFTGYIKNNLKLKKKHI